MSDPMMSGGMHGTRGRSLGGQRDETVMLARDDLAGPRGGPVTGPVPVTRANAAVNRGRRVAGVPLDAVVAAVIAVIVVATVLFVLFGLQR